MGRKELNQTNKNKYVGEKFCTVLCRRRLSVVVVVVVVVVFKCTSYKGFHRKQTIS